MTRGLFVYQGHDRYLQPPADCFRNLSNRHTLFCDRVIPRPGRSLLKRQPIDGRRIEPVHRRPAVEPDADIGRYSLSRGRARSCRWRGPACLGRGPAACAPPTHARRTPPSRLPSAPTLWEIRLSRRRHIVLCREAVGRGGQPGGDDQRPIRTFKRVAHHLDGTLVCLTVLRKLREVVIEGGLNDAVRHGCPTAQASQVFQISSMHLSASSDQRRGALI